MKKSVFVFLGVLVVVVALIFTSIAPKPSAIAAANDEQNLTLVEKTTKAQAEAALAFWTKDAMVNAEAMVMPVDYGPSGPDVFALGQEALGTSGASPAGTARTNANAIARKAYASEWVNTGQSESDVSVDEPTGTSQIFTSFYGNLNTTDWKIYPHKWVGRFSFTTPSGTSYCSATAISNNHIVTAAHCVYDTSSRNAWYTNKVFTPAYRNGNAPYGTFATTGCRILTAWANLSGSFSINSWTRYDLAVCNVGTNSIGKTLNYMVGWAGRTWNQSYTRNFFNMGYPFKDTNNAYLPNAGNYMRICTAESRQQTTDTLGMGCNFGGGISGGPWMVGYAPNVISGQVNSVNSGLYIGQQNLYGIRFNDQNIVVICNVEGC